MVKSTVIGITPTTHGASHIHGGTDPVTGDVRVDNLYAMTSQADVTGSRAFGTNYQNTYGVPLHVQVAMWNGSSTDVQAYTDASTPPTVEVAKDRNESASDYAFISFVVLPNNYYKVVSSGSGKLWIETY